MQEDTRRACSHFLFKARNITWFIRY